MSKIAIWCRHKGDNVIGIGPNIPWHIKSDFQRFKRITEGQYLVAGEKTYESFPGRTLPNRKIVVLTFNPLYEVSDKNNHFVCTNVKDLAEFEHDLYIAGGASVYKLFMSDKALMPDIIVDCEYGGELNASLKGDKIDITFCVDVMTKDYQKISQDYLLDGVKTSVWVKKGDFIEQKTLKYIVEQIEKI